ncbi:unnamed protein product [Echinostoma caproni]|uniref:Uncharacterized protein n=1 Tax=Echinostoma caproni TaxID=27848 RepID=A0A3P8LFM3_9TREM|nr:unnamed protein product [Echinostoma caproni]
MNATPASGNADLGETRSTHSSGDHNDRSEDGGRDLLHPNVRLYLSAGNVPPKSLVLNYAGHLFILQPSRVTDQDEEDEEERIRLTQQNGPRTYVRVRCSAYRLYWFVRFSFC